jgi:hypothetical protein
VIVVVEFQIVMWPFRHKYSYEGSAA